MAKSKKVSKKPVVRRSSKVDSLTAEFNNFKIQQTKQLTDLKDDVKIIRKETITMSRLIGSLLDLISDISNIPEKVIGERFMFYCGERHPVDSNGKVKGSVKVVGYNFELEGLENEGCIVQC